MSVEYKDYYKILGVDRKATDDEIKRAFRKLALKYHPDHNPGDKSAEQKFKDVNEANEVLSDPQKRRQYDLLGSSWKDGQSFTPPPGWGGFGPGAQTINFSNMGGNMGGMSDFFKLLMGGMGGAQNINFGNMGGGRGARQNINFGDFADFGGMGGTGAQSRCAQKEAPIIDLTLSVDELLDPSPKSISISQGAQTKTIKVNIPKGAKDKTVFKLKGQAPDGGDVRIRVCIPSTKDVSTNEYDIIQKLKITPWEAAFGVHLDCHTVAGDVKLTIPAGVSSGQKLRLSDRGLYTRDGRGDLLMEIMIAMPKKLTPQEKSCFEQLASCSKFNPREA